MRSAEITLAEERKGASLHFLKLGLGRGLCLRDSNNKDRPTPCLNRHRYLGTTGCPCPRRFPMLQGGHSQTFTVHSHTHAVSWCHFEKEHQQKALENSRGKTLYEKENAGKRKDNWWKRKKENRMERKHTVRARVWSRVHQCVMLTYSWLEAGA